MKFLHSHYSTKKKFSTFW